MKRLVFLGTGMTALALAGCGGAGNDRPAASEPAAAPDPPAAEVAADAAATPMMVGGYQVVRVIVRDTGYTPDRIRLESGVPVKMVFVQEATSHCASQIRIPAMGVPTTDLPAGKETVVEFSPGEAGTYAFTCGMDMLRGTLEVGA